jgi:palmitoyl-protein thioesterase
MLTFTLILSLLATGSSQKDAIDGLNSLLTRVQTDPDKFINEIAHSNFVTISPTIPKVTKRSSRNSEDILPLVFLHGMGDSCFNNGMQSITEESGTYMGVYSVCIPTGDTREEDTMNGIYTFVIII